MTLTPGPLTSIDGLALGDILRVIDPGADTNLVRDQLVQVDSLVTDIDRRHVHHTGSPGRGGHYFTRFAFVAHDPAFVAAPDPSASLGPMSVAERVFQTVIDGLGEAPGADPEYHELAAEAVIRGWDNIELLEAISAAMETT